MNRPQAKAWRGYGLFRDAQCFGIRCLLQPARLFAATSPGLFRVGRIAEFRDADRPALAYGKVENFLWRHIEGIGHFEHPGARSQDFADLLLFNRVLSFPD